jgi:inner membrane protein
MQWGDKTHVLEPGTLLDQPSAGAHVRLPADWRDNLDQPISLSLRLKGSRMLRVAPVGVQTQVELSSSWRDPSFIGSVLPSERKLGPEGFSASWNASYYSRNFPQSWTTSNGSSYKSQLTDSGMGVELLTLIDSYRSVNRAVKYGILLVGLVFGTFFVLELKGSTAVHPFQYVLVGMTLVVFYLGLLSLSEFAPFWLAYLVPALVATGMISAYSHAMLRKTRQAAFIFIGLALVYAFMFVLLRLAEYSLLLGSAGLFLVLGLAMWVTRNVQWYRPAAGQAVSGSPDSK